MFNTDAKGANRLFIDGIEVMRNRIKAPRLSGKIKLNAGKHSIRLLIAQSEPLIEIKEPGAKDFVTIPLGALSCDASIEKQTASRLVAELLPEIGSDGELNVRSPSGAVSARIIGGSIVDGRKGKAIKLAPVAKDKQRINVKNLPSPEDESALAFWIRFDKGHDVWFMKGDFSDHPTARMRRHYGYAEIFRGSPRAGFDIRKDLKLGESWHHFAFTYGKTVRTYVNGKIVSEAVRGNNNHNSHLRNPTLFTGIEGVVEDIKLYSKVLTPQEIEVLYAGGTVQEQK
jgi:hypothetical protein